MEKMKRKQDLRKIEKNYFCFREKYNFSRTCLAKHLIPRILIIKFGKFKRKFNKEKAMLNKNFNLDLGDYILVLSDAEKKEKKYKKTAKISDVFTSTTPKCQVIHFTAPGVPIINSLKKYFKHKITINTK